MVDIRGIGGFVYDIDIIKMLETYVWEQHKNYVQCHNKNDKVHISMGMEE